MVKDDHLVRSNVLVKAKVSGTVEQFLDVYLTKATLTSGKPHPLSEIGSTRPIRAYFRWDLSIDAVAGLSSSPKITLNQLCLWYTRMDYGRTRGQSR